MHQYGALYTLPITLVPPVSLRQVVYSLLDFRSWRLAHPTLKVLGQAVHENRAFRVFLSSRRKSLYTVKNSSPYSLRVAALLTISRWASSSQLCLTTIHTKNSDRGSLRKHGHSRAGRAEIEGLRAVIHKVSRTALAKGRAFIATHVELPKSFLS